jgi:hypothetical protein
MRASFFIEEISKIRSGDRRDPKERAPFFFWRRLEPDEFAEKRHDLAPLERHAGTKTLRQSTMRFGFAVLIQNAVCDRQHPVSGSREASQRRLRRASGRRLRHIEPDGGEGGSCRIGAGYEVIVRCRTRC